MVAVIACWPFLRALVGGATTLALENAALRHQLAVLQRSGRRPRLHRWDRILWVWLSRWWANWRSSLVIVQPATVPAWHRRGFQLYWRWTSLPNPVGRPRLNAELRHLIRRMARESPTWGRRRIQAELALLGDHVAERTVAKCMRRASPRPSPTWRASLAAHAREIVAIDFFVVPTLTFRLLFVCVVLRHHRREPIHFNVSDHPTAAWTARQLVEAFPDDTAPRFVLRDRDAIYGPAFSRRAEGLGIREVLTAPRAPWQNPFAERVIGSIRGECLNQVLILGEAHLRRLLHGYGNYYHTTRPHQSLNNNSPHPRVVEPPARGRIIALPQVGGLHHRDQRVACPRPDTVAPIARGTRHTATPVRSAQRCVLADSPGSLPDSFISGADGHSRRVHSEVAAA